jgi:hypothetical protein
MDAGVLAAIELGLRAIAAIAPGFLALFSGTADDEAALEKARTSAREAIAKIRRTPVDDAVRDAIEEHERQRRSLDDTRPTPVPR